MICKRCGNEFEEGVFCPECGMKHEEACICSKTDGETIYEENIETPYQEFSQKVSKDEVSQGNEKNAKRIPWYLSIWFIILICISTLYMFCIPGIILGIVRFRKCRELRRKEVPFVHESSVNKLKKEGTEEGKIPWYLSIWFIVVISILTFWLFWIPGIVLGIMRFFQCKTKRISAIVITTLLLSPYIWIVISLISFFRVENQFNAYIENEQYESAKEFIQQEYAEGTSTYVDKYVQLYEAQKMYDEAVCIQIEYCINEYEPIDIPDYIINDLNEYIEKYGSELCVDTVEKVHNLVNSKEVAKAEEEERKAEAAAKAEEIQEAKAAKENNSKIDVKNKDMVVNSSNQTNMNNVSNSAKTFYNNGHPHTYKYEDKNCCIIAELSVKEDKKDSPIDIYIIRYDNGNDFETYSRDAVLNSVQDEKGNDRGVNGAYYRGWDIDSGTDIFVEFNYETEYCRIRMDVSPIENISGFDYVFDYEYVYYPEELDGVDDGILDIDDIDID